MEEWRTLIYPLGFISSLAFGARFLIQWIQSEAKGKSLVSPLFWQLSLLGNVALVIHSLFQVQFHICLIQACNGVISWRNLDLMRKKCFSFSTTLFILFFAIFFVTLGFWLTADSWFRIPKAPWQSEKAFPTSLEWHLFGFFGYALFSSRFWIQWIFAEKLKRSVFPISFWWISLLGAIISSIYFVRIQDTINLLGSSIGLIPYLRNLMLLYKKQGSVLQ